jgi:transposase
VFARSNNSILKLFYEAMLTDPSFSEHQTITRPSIVAGEPPLRPEVAATSDRSQSSVYRRAGKQLSDVQCGRIYAYLELGWLPKTIAAKLAISTSVVTSIERNLKTYGSIRPPQLLPRGRPYQMTLADEDALLEYILSYGWRSQDEMVWWLREERNVKVTQSTISRMLKRRKWNQKELRIMSMTRNKELREAFRRDMSQFEDRDLIFLDESIFNEKTGWRHRAYAPVGHEARYTQSVRRGATYAIIAATTLEGWLSCTAMKRGYYSAEEFVHWLQNHLVPTAQERFEGRRPVIVMDNCSIHTGGEVEAALQRAGFLVRYLPPYSPDFNPIELTFSVLKAWIRRNWVESREQFANFEDFLWFAIRYSRCDDFIKKQFAHAAGGIYTAGNNCREFYQFLEKWERGEGEDLEQASVMEIESRGSCRHE